MQYVSMSWSKLLLGLGLVTDVRCMDGLDVDGSVLRFRQ